ncbi:hypothetical protein [Amycolatopsis taiwanensis]|uniref:Uncharacterized protein n=1 Tax=Amycolatopsis taiwanensis TaxID=342230 RepID=A0A9W6VKM8_9PSEU|nr:hypothetical protein [Amycolatopsis taiwanensis]GLY70779.1 hypothetical protein Atai01_73980 [Amycolatopsis taiwanensis]
MDTNSAGSLPGFRRRWLLPLIVAVAVIVAVGTLLTIRLQFTSGEDAAATMPTTAGRAVARGYACGGDRSDPDLGNMCERQVRDYARRSELTTQQQAEITGATARLQSWFPQLPQQLKCDVGTGRCQVQFDPIDETYVAAARSAVARAGYPNAVMRLARPDDPAPTGSLVYGIPVGSGCTVGYLNSGGATYHVVGPLPEGTCLTP